MTTDASDGTAMRTISRSIGAGKPFIRSSVSCGADAAVAAALCGPSAEWSADSELDD